MAERSECPGDRRRPYKGGQFASGLRRSLVKKPRNPGPLAWATANLRLQVSRRREKRQLEADIVNAAGGSMGAVKFTSGDHGAAFLLACGSQGKSGRLSSSSPTLKRKI